MNMATRRKLGYERRKRWSDNAVRRKAEIRQARHADQMRQDHFREMEEARIRPLENRLSVETRLPGL